MPPVGHDDNEGELRGEVLHVGLLGPGREGVACAVEEVEHGIAPPRRVVVRRQEDADGAVGDDQTPGHRHDHVDAVWGITDPVGWQRRRPRNTQRQSQSKSERPHGVRSLAELPTTVPIGQRKSGGPRHRSLGHNQEIPERGATPPWKSAFRNAAIPRYRRS